MLFFDLDGTLLDSNGIWLEIDIEFLGRHGIAPVPEDYTDYVAHHGAEESAVYTRRRFGLTESEGEILQAWKDMAREAYASRLPLKPGAGEFLARCRQAGYSMALLTSCMPQLCRAALAHHGLEGVFAQVVTTQELGLEKRDPEFYRRAAALCHGEVGESILFEDAPNYCAAARKAGLSVAGVADPLFEARREEFQASCTYWVDSFLDLPPELERRLFPGK